MTPERWQQIEKIFQAALDYTPEERVRFVSEACANDLDLKSDVETLLLQHESAGSLLEKPVNPQTDSRSLGALETDETLDPLIGRRLGSYRIEREIGRGGMGAVYEAARDDNEFRKRVAIKLVSEAWTPTLCCGAFAKSVKSSPPWIIQTSPCYWTAAQLRTACLTS